MSELISIIVPVYNVDKYLSKCLDSIINQTYKNLEIILVDDGSTDASSKICDEYAESDERITVIHKKNAGLSSARNAGLDIAKGDYIGFVDSDDYIDAYMYENLYAAAIKNNVKLVICGHFVEKDDKISIEISPIDEERLYDKNEALELLLDDKNIKNYAWDKLYKSCLFENVRYPEGKNYEDIYTTYLLFDKCEQICYIPHYSYYYQLRNDSISSNINDEKWHRNCLSIIEGMIERNRYFINTKSDDIQIEKRIILKSFACIIPYVINYIKLGYKLKNNYKQAELKQFLKDNRQSIENNLYIENKFKLFSKIYSGSSLLSVCFMKIMSLHINDRAFIRKINSAKSIKRRMSELKFDLCEGKDKRIFIFELPCFDNLGDHAIAYAIRKYFTDFVKENENYQIICIDGWDTVAAIYKLKKEIRPDDIIVCQGGGNMGNLYMFAEIFRRKTVKAFKNNRIIIFPQTIYFTDDEEGIAELKKSRDCYNSCHDLTIFARDEKSYEIMKENFSCKIIKLVDSVTYIDTPLNNRRNGILLCLRSDIESSLDKEQKKKLLDVCRLKDSVLLTDTVAKHDISSEERENVLKEKWILFSGKKVVVTDRLHGMIFSLITHTPCIILGNNHHKVKETYKTLSDCNYLHYAENVVDVERLLKTIYNDDENDYFKPDYTECFNVVSEIIRDVK